MPTPNFPPLTKKIHPSERSPHPLHKRSSPLSFLPHQKAIPPCLSQYGYSPPLSSLSRQGNHPHCALDGYRPPPLSFNINLVPPHSLQRNSLPLSSRLSRRGCRERKVSLSPDRGSASLEGGEGRAVASAGEAHVASHLPLHQSRAHHPHAFTHFPAPPPPCPSTQDATPKLLSMSHFFK